MRRATKRRRRSRSWWAHVKELNSGARGSNVSNDGRGTNLAEPGVHIDANLVADREPRAGLDEGAAEGDVAYLRLGRHGSLDARGIGFFQRDPAVPPRPRKRVAGFSTRFVLGAQAFRRRVILHERQGLFGRGAQARRFGVHKPLVVPRR